MAKVKITLTGVPEKAPKIYENGNVDLIFKVQQSLTLPKGLEPLKECACLVHVAPKTWKKVQGHEGLDESKLLIQGEVKSSVNKKGVPFLEMVAMDMSILEKQEKRVAAADGAAQHQEQATKQEKKPATGTGTAGTQEVAVEKKAPVEVPQSGTTPLTPIKTQPPLREAREQWYKDEDVFSVQVRDILLTEPIHAQAKSVQLPKHLAFYAEHPDEPCQPIVVRKQADGTYSLVTGIQRYFLAKVLDREHVPAILTNLTHDAFLQAQGWTEFDTSAPRQRRKKP